MNRDSMADATEICGLTFLWPRAPSRCSGIRKVVQLDKGEQLARLRHILQSSCLPSVL